MTYLNSATGFKSSSEVTLPSTADARLWWAAESRRVGTDWRTLIDCAQAALSELRVMHVGASSS
ncbi:MAG TPA: hypothetical protein VKG24_22865 [Pseudolabrys sp.]|nr:hypothetical protein [Pseudolabrys sp.]